MIPVPANIETGLLVAIMLALLVLQFGDVLARRLGLIDTPCDRKDHTGEIPLTGGFAVIGGLSLFFLWYAQNTSLSMLVFGGVAFFCLGVIDDIRPVGGLVKLCIQSLLVSLIMLTTNTYIPSLGALPLVGDMTLPPALSFVVTLLFVLLVTNAVNLLDGHDGVAAGVMLVSFCVLVLVVGRTFDHLVTLLLAYICAPLLVFWFYNSGLWGRKAFLGDSGSLMLGFILSWLIVHLLNTTTVSNASHNALGFYVWCVFLPCVDAVSVLCRRWLRGRPLLQPDRTHLHHQLIDRGWHKLNIMALMVWLHVGFVALGWGLQVMVPAWSLLLALGGAVIYILVLHHQLGSQAAKPELSA